MQLVACQTQEPEVPSSILGAATCFCKFLPLIQEGQLSVTGTSMSIWCWLTRNGVVRLNNHPNMTLAVYD